MQLEVCKVSGTEGVKRENSSIAQKVSRYSGVLKLHYRTSSNSSLTGVSVDWPLVPSDLHAILMSEFVYFIKKLD